jgi:hypothetical protein
MVLYRFAVFLRSVQTQVWADSRCTNGTHLGQKAAAFLNTLSYFGPSYDKKKTARLNKVKGNIE